MAGKFEIKEGASGKFRFNLKAGNGQIILSSESYESKQGAEKGVESVRKNASDDNRYEHKTAKNDEAFFVLKAGNGEPLGRERNLFFRIGDEKWYRIGQTQCGGRGDCLPGIIHSDCYRHYFHLARFSRRRRSAFAGRD